MKYVNLRSKDPNHYHILLRVWAWFLTCQIDSIQSLQFSFPMPWRRISPNVNFQRKLPLPHSCCWIEYQSTNHHATALDLSSSETFDPDIPQPLPNNYQEHGNQLIVQAGETCGATEDMLEIEWKSQKIIVTVHSDSVYVSNGDDNIVDMEEEIEVDDDFDDDFDDDMDLSELEPEPEEDRIGQKGVDVTELARAINNALEEDGSNGGWSIAQRYEIEVTTPGTSDELVGDIMFEAYKGFDVICIFQDLKKNKKKGQKETKEKEINGKLVERTEDYTKINIKGRMKSIPNGQIVSVKLPKAKKEKGVR